MSLANVILAVVAGIAGFLIARFFSGKKEGEQGRIRSVLVPIGQYRIHFHHWVVALTILLVLWAIGWTPPIVVGFLLGLIVQGLTYKDFYRIVYKG